MHGKIIKCGVRYGWGEVFFDNVGEALDLAEGLNPVSRNLLKDKAGADSLVFPSMTFVRPLFVLRRIASNLERRAPDNPLEKGDRMIELSGQLMELAARPNNSHNNPTAEH